MQEETPRTESVQSGTHLEGRTTTPVEGDSLETLVVISKVKKFIRDQGGLNTSQDAIDALSTVIAVVCERAIMRAREDGRKTVLGRDIELK